MEERLKNLKKSMDRTTFSQLNFTEQHQKEIREKISKQDEKEEDILLAILHLLVHEKTGFELANLLRARGIKKFEDNEGSIYILLHKLEQNQWIQAYWNETEIKNYRITDKGSKLLKKAVKQKKNRSFILKELLMG